MLLLGASLTLITAGSAGGGQGRPLPAPPGLGEANERREAHKRFLAGAEGRGARARSRTAFRNLPAGAALRAGRDAFPEVLASRPVGGLPLAAGEQLVGYAGDMAALVDRPEGGPPALVESTVPLRAAGEGEPAEPIDLALERVGEWYVPRRVPVGVRFPRRLADGILLSGVGLRVTPRGAPGGEADSADGRLSWANVAADTDFSVVPRFDGFETFHVLRSADSPEELRLGLDLPRGATLRRAAGGFPGTASSAGGSSSAGGLEVVRGEELLATISAPLAFDAQRRVVPVSVEVAGGDVVLRVAHRDRDLAYPLLVDPIVEDQQFWNGRCSWDPYNPNCQAPPKDQNGWSFVSNSDEPIQTTDSSSLGWGAGRYIWSQEHAWYNDGEQGNWSFQAPGNSRITSAHFNFLRGQMSGAEACVFVGMVATAPPAWQSQWGSCSDFWDQQIVIGHAGSPHNQAVFLYWMNGTGWRPAQGVSQMGGALVVLEDDYDPYLYQPQAHHNRPAGWTARAAPQADVFVQDDGLGARAVSVLHPGMGGGTVERKPTFPNGRDYYCEGGRNDRCPAQLGWGVPYNTDDMPEGINEVRARGYDVVGRMATSAPWQLKVDRSAPSLTLSGSLKAAENTQLAPGSYELQAAATDGDPNGPAAGRRSGVRSVEILLDGESVQSGTQECPADSCPLSRGFSFDTRQHPGGVHRVEVRATDQLGQVSSRSFAFTTAQVASTGEHPLSSFSDQQLTDRSSLGVNVANGNLLLRNADLRVAGTGLDLGVGRFYNSLSAETGSLGRRWTMSTSEDVRIRDHQDGSVTFYGSSGYVVFFKAKPDGSFQPPRGVRATLRRVTDTTYELTENATQEKGSFASSGRESWGRLTAQTDRYGNRIGFAYSGAGKLSSITDTQGRVTTVARDSAGRVERLTDPAGRVYRYGYDAQGRLTTYTNPGAGNTGYAYDASDRLVSITTPAGRVTKVTYDAQGRVASVVRTTDAAHTAGPTTRFAYGGGAPCADGQAKTVVSDPEANGSNGHTTTYCADSHAAVRKAVDSSGNATTVSYDVNGNVTSEKRPQGGVTNYGYDPTTRDLVCVQRGATVVQGCQSAPGGLKTIYAYANTDALTRHFPTRVTNPQGNSVTVCYNGSTPSCGTSSGPPGSVQSVTNELSTQNVRRFSYNAKGNLTAATDARGFTTGYGYDAQGNNLTSVVPPAGAGLGSWTVSRDRLGRPASVTDGEGQTSTYSYDSLDRLTGLAYPGGPTFGYTYDADGARKTLSDPGGTTTYTVDQLGRLTGEQFPEGGSNSYTWDAASNLRTVTDPGGSTTYAHNGLNQLSSVTEPGASQATTFASNPDGARTQIRYPSGVTVNHAYDTASGRTLSVINRAPSGAVLKSYSYTYLTPAGRDTELAQTVTDQASNTTTNSYDRLDRLTDAVTGGPQPSSYHFAFDGEGNRIRETINHTASTDGNTKTFAYDSANLPCWSADGDRSSYSCANPPPASPPPNPGRRDYTHDRNGNDLYNTHQRYTYNAANQANTVAVATLGTAYQQLAYRGPGQTKLIQDGTYTLQNTPLGISSRGTSRYTRATDGTLLTQRSAGTQTSQTGPGTTQATQTTEPQRRNYLYDAEGSVTALTDDNGSLRTSYTYDPYGHPPNRTPLGDENPFGYRGAYTTGVQAAGIICGGPNQTGGSYWDAEDGRSTQLAVGGGRVPDFFGEVLPELPSLDEIADGINDVGGAIQEGFDGGKRFLRSGSGRCALVGGVFGAAAVIGTKSPGAYKLGQRAWLTILGGTFGCGAGASRLLP